MTTVSSKYLGDLRAEATHLQSDTTIITDAPTDNQGKGESFSPTDLVATALGSCMVTIMGIAAQTHKFDLTGLTWGNLSSHLSKLEEEGYVAVEKEIVGKKPHSMVLLTEAGRTAFRIYKQSMQQVLDELPD